MGACVRLPIPQRLKSVPEANNPTSKPDFGPLFISQCPKNGRKCNHKWARLHDLRFFFLDIGKNSKYVGDFNL